MPEKTRRSRNYSVGTELILVGGALALAGIIIVHVQTRSVKKTLAVLGVAAAGLVWLFSKRKGPKPSIKEKLDAIDNAAEAERQQIQRDTADAIKQQEAKNEKAQQEFEEETEHEIAKTATSDLDDLARRMAEAGRRDGRRD